MSITSVICHPGIQYSFLVQVKLLPLSASPIAMGRRLGVGGVGSDPAKVLALAGERAREIESAPLQSNPWVGIKESIVEH